MGIIRILDLQVYPLPQDKLEIVLVDDLEYLIPGLSVFAKRRDDVHTVQVESHLRDHPLYVLQLSIPGHNTPRSLLAHQGKPRKARSTHYKRRYRKPGLAAGTDTRQQMYAPWR